MTADPKPDKEPPPPKVAKKPLPLWAALAIALGLIGFPAVIVGPLLAPFIILWAGCALALSFKSQFAQVRKQRLRNLAIYLFASIMTVVWHSSRVDEAQAKGDALVAAIKTFRAENRRYPAKLDELVPKHTDTIPIAAYGRFFYHLSAENNAEPSFFFVTLPPFGRRAYCFEDVVPCTNLSVVPVTKNTWYDFD